MGLFDTNIQEITAFLGQKKAKHQVAEFIHTRKTNWPLSRRRNLVLGQDTGIELGNPKDASTACLVWGNNLETIKNRCITIVGPDLNQGNKTRRPFGKIVIIGGIDFNEENHYRRYRELEQVRYDIHLHGYMMRGASQFQREWSRVSKQALSDGFSLNMLGGALMDRFFTLPFVRSVEIIFITSDTKDVVEISRISKHAMNIIGAMNKMAGEMSFDCDSCEYTDVCSDVAELRSMHRSKMNKESNAYA